MFERIYLIVGNFHQHEGYIFAKFAGPLNLNSENLTSKQWSLVVV